MQFRRYFQKGLGEPLLCADCEQRFSRYERYASLVLNGGLELGRHFALVDPVQGLELVDLYGAEALPDQLFPSRDPVRSAALMAALDAVNLRYGRNTLRPGGGGQKRVWSMRQSKLSPCYTTRFEDILQARAI